MKGKQERIKVETIERLKRYESVRQKETEVYQRRSINEMIEDVLKEIDF